MTVIELDDRRRAALGKIGHKDHSRYLVTEQEDGTLIWTPAAVVPLGLAASLRQAAQDARDGKARDMEEVLRENGL